MKDPTTPRDPDLTPVSLRAEVSKIFKAVSSFVILRQGGKTTQNGFHRRQIQPPNGCLGRQSQMEYLPPHTKWEEGNPEGGKEAHTD